MTQIHASALAIDEQAILLRGPSGSGKSDLALRMIEQGAQLVADDRVNLIKKGADLVAFAPDTIAGLLEVRHLGIIKLAHCSAAPVRLVVDLIPHQEPERLPDWTPQTFEGVELPHIQIDPFHASAPAKLSLALALALGHMSLEEATH